MQFRNFVKLFELKIWIRFINNFHKFFSRKILQKSTLEFLQCSQNLSEIVKFFFQFY